MRALAAALLLAGCAGFGEALDLVGELGEAPPAALGPIVILPDSAGRPVQVPPGARVYTWSQWQAHCATAFEPACARARP